MKKRIKIVLSVIGGLLIGSCLFPEYTADLEFNVPDIADAQMENDSSFVDVNEAQCINQKFCNNQCEDYTIDNGCYDIKCDPCYQGDHMQTICDSISGCLYSCDVGFDNCDDNLANGCETDLSNTDEHCFSCDNDCHNGEWHMNCVNAKCQCGGAWNDCNNDLSDGCEQDFWANTSCGACDSPCPIGKHCQFGTCIF